MTEHCGGFICIVIFIYTLASGLSDCTKGKIGIDKTCNLIMYIIHHTTKSLHSISLDSLIYYEDIHKSDEALACDGDWTPGDIQTGRGQQTEWDQSRQQYFVRSVVIRWINESETIPEMEINLYDIAVMLCIYQCQARIWFISQRTVSCLQLKIG